MNIATENSTCFRQALPEWVPEGVMHYLEHTEMGQPIRALARVAGCHASTILRQIRRVETRRDDPLIDAALRRLGAVHQDPTIKNGNVNGPGNKSGAPKGSGLPDNKALNKEAIRVLRRLCETGAVLAVAAEMEKAVVVRDTVGGGSARTAVVSANVAQAMALKEWITPGNTGRIVRYHITGIGRTALQEMLNDPELMQLDPVGLAESPANFIAKEPNGPSSDAATRSRRVRYALAESPLSALARRKDVQGKPFLSDKLVATGERLREDFELAQMSAKSKEDWGHYLISGASKSGEDTLQRNDAPSKARARVAAALVDLGPGLSDVVLRCCCYLEGLEAAERQMGWSARSGKVVLRIALMRLQRHYEETTGPGGPMIG